MKKRLPISGIKYYLLVVFIYTFLSIGQVAYAIKFNVPWFGTNDFSSYYQMTLDPLNHGVSNPWHAGRILTPALAWIVLKLNIYIRTDYSPFIEKYSEVEQISYDENVLFSLITVNYLGLLLAALMIHIILKKTFENNLTNNILIFAAPLLIFLSPFVNFSGLTGITEGISILLVTLGLLFIKNNNYKSFLLLLILSIFQRELLPLLLFFIVLFLPISSFGIKWLLPATLVFAISILRIFIYDTDLTSRAIRLTNSSDLFADLSIHNIFVSIIYLNLFVIYFVLIIMNNNLFNSLKQFAPVILFVLSLVLLYMIQPVGLQNLIRMISLANPLMILLIVGSVVNIINPGRSKNILLENGLTLNK